MFYFTSVPSKVIFDKRERERERETETERGGRGTEGGRETGRVRERREREREGPASSVSALVVSQGVSVTGGMDTRDDQKKCPPRRRIEG